MGCLAVTKTPLPPSCSAKMTPGFQFFTLGEGRSNPRLKGWEHRGIPLELLSDSVVWEAMACAASPSAARAVRVFAAVRCGETLRVQGARERVGTERARQLARRGFNIVATYAAGYCVEYLPLAAAGRKAVQHLPLGAAERKAVQHPQYLGSDWIKRTLRHWERQFGPLYVDPVAVERTEQRMRDAGYKAPRALLTKWGFLK